MPIDPAIGIAMDRTRSRFGRYRLWYVLGLPILAGSVYMLFNPQPGAGKVFRKVQIRRRRVHGISTHDEQQIHTTVLNIVRELFQ